MLRVIAMSSSCVNPILYGWLNDNFRSAFLGIVFANRAKKKSKSSTTEARTTRMDGMQLNTRGRPGSATGCRVGGESPIVPSRNGEDQHGRNNSGGGVVGGMVRPLSEINPMDRKYGAMETAVVDVLAEIDPENRLNSYV